MLVSDSKYDLNPVNRLRDFLLPRHPLWFSGCREPAFENRASSPENHFTALPTESTASLFHGDALTPPRDWWGSLERSAIYDDWNPGEIHAGTRSHMEWQIPSSPLPAPIETPTRFCSFTAFFPLASVAFSSGKIFLFLFFGFMNFWQEIFMEGVGEKGNSFLDSRLWCSRE